MTFSALEILGYFASVVVAVSLMMKSIIRLRWYNLVGAVAFAVYGLLVHAYPVFVVNGFIAFVDIYYLWRIYTNKEKFDIMEVNPDNPMLERFLDFHGEDIERFFPGLQLKEARDPYIFFIFRNMLPVGLFAGRPSGGQAMTILIDYAIPDFRDLKSSRYLYHNRSELFLKRGIRRLEIRSSHPHYTRFLKKIGFKQEGGGHVFYMELSPRKKAAKSF